MKHTQGKWLIEDRSDNITQVISYDINTAEAKDICVVSDDWNEQVANATLIASSPELLQLLKDILAEVRPEISRVNSDAGCTIFNPVATETIDMAKDLIAKAEGK